MYEIKHTGQTLKLSGENGNVFNLIGIASRRLRQLGLREDAKFLQEEAVKQKSYDDVLVLIMKFFEVV
jgi:hypothetical protein